ncbi:MAG: glycosyltransferase [Ruminococcus flavefaciens]|nr:glycosyltransferase [Ruminococcus flavefaciens]
MAIYVFSLLVGYAPNGVDYAQGYRAKILQKLPYTVRYIFAEIPGRRDINFYKSIGVKEEDMLSMHHYFLDHPTLQLSVKAVDKLEELKKSLNVNEVVRQGQEIRLVKDGAIAASMILAPENPEYLLEIYYFNQSKMLRTEVYTDSLAYADYFVTASSESGFYAKRTRRAYYYSNGSVAYEQIFEGDKIRYLFPDGRVFTKSEFIAEFIKKLNLSETDTVLIDRFAQFDYVQPLFQRKQAARVIAVMHAGHYFEPGESAYTVNFNQDYNYLMKYTGMVDVIVVSTRQQKEELAEKLQEYGRSVPEIRVIPAGGVDKLHYPDGERKPYSILSVSRIQTHKRIHWIIESVVRAHQINENISLDIYGSGSMDYINELKKTVEKYQAQSYVRFMGHQDVTEVYKNYELFVTASTFETLGLSVMEAISSGNAVIGLTVKYGSQLMIHPEENGYLVDFRPGHDSEEEDRIIDSMAEKIVEVFEDRERLRRFQERSYEIAGGFSTRMVEEKWRKLLS